MHNCSVCENSNNKASSSKAGKIFLIIILIFGVFAVYKSWPAKSFKESTEDVSEALDFTTQDIYGNQVNLSDFRGQKPVLLVFWATWCGYCAKEKDDLKVFTKKYKDTVQVLAVASGEAKRTIQDYIKEKDINFLMLLDEQREIWNQYLVRGTPSHFLIDKNGKIMAMRPGLASLNDLEIMMSMVKP